MSTFAPSPSTFKQVGAPGGYLSSDDPKPGDLWVDMSVPALKRLVSNNPDVWVSVEGGGGPSFADAEVPTGAINGVNVTFTLAASPSPSLSLALYRNGVLQEGGGVDYTLSSATITFVAAPGSGDILLAFYRH